MYADVEEEILAECLAILFFLIIFFFFFSTAFERIVGVSRLSPWDGGMATSEPGFNWCLLNLQRLDSLCVNWHAEII